MRRDAITKCLRAIQLVEYGEIDESIGFDFNQLNKQREADAAFNAKTRIDGLAVLADRQAISAEEFRTAIKNDKGLGLDFLSDEMPEGDPQDFQSDPLGAQQPPTKEPHPAAGKNDAEAEVSVGNEETENS